MAPENDQPHTNDAGAVLLAASQVVGVRIHGSHALVLGVVKARYTRQRPVWAGLEFLVVVTLGTVAGVGLGLLLHGG